MIAFRECVLISINQKMKKWLIFPSVLIRWEYLECFYYELSPYWKNLWGMLDEIVTVTVNEVCD